jgi:serine/threonine protein phosphatase 1
MNDVISRLFKSLSAARSAPEPRPPQVPAGVRVYAIGDIHGRLDLLERLLSLIEADARPARGKERVLIYLGDYIDRGPSSREVVDRVMAPHEMVDRVVRLRGNHEEAMLTFIADVELGRAWLDYGGIATLHSYGVRLPPDLSAQERFAAMAKGLAQALPPEHRAFYERLELSETIGDYFFVHAGINPALPIAEQDEFDLTTIRAPFLDWGRPLEKVVVHGHSIAPEPQLLPWRIGIDTGAYATGHLTALVLEGGEQRILST